MGRCLSVIAVVLLLTGCSGSNRSSSASELLGEWKTRICDFEPGSTYYDAGHWEEVVYDFKRDERIIKTLLVYDDSTCSGEFQRIESADGMSSAGFSDLGEAQLEEGVDGGVLQLRLFFLNESYTYEGFYTVSDQTICFSDLFNFDTIAISASIDGRTAIDYENCLVRMGYHN